MPQHVLTKFMRVRAGAAPGGVRQSEGRKCDGLDGALEQDPRELQDITSPCW